MTYKLTRDDLKTLGNGIRNANSMSVEEHLDAFLADKKTNDWQIISSGVARIDYVFFDHKVLFIGYGHQPIYLLMKYIEDNHLDGKTIEIAVREVK